ncbi:hypothetical protein [Rodentibacter caecimuris]|uniref:hypothetical protein n=1 Tax=Rodentibacter caecimuris TaxID=1796644 RepID=UPI0013A0ABC7|nr:hypothetical protein [Rodentibacter heylii]QIA76138.1 hypothetical protein FEE42_01575 [Rodentibacter heylii]
MSNFDDENVLTPYEAMSLAIHFFPDNYLSFRNEDVRIKRIQEVCNVAKRIRYEANCTFIETPEP